MSDNEYDCVGCGSSLTAVAYGYEAPDHKLCWECSSDEVTNLRARIEKAQAALLVLVEEADTQGTPGDLARVRPSDVMSIAKELTKDSQCT